MTEQIIDILKSDVIVSKKRGAFSTPAEITAHVNLRLDSAYSAKAIAESLKTLGWSVSGKRRIKRLGKACNFYHRQGDIESKALLDPSASANTQSEPQSKSSDVESLSEIDKTFKIARRDKEENLASIRKVEISSATHREKHLRLQLEKDRGELVSVKDVVQEWEMRLNELKIELFNLPLKYSSRWSSINDEAIIQEEFERELNTLCTRLAEGKNEAIKTKDEILENDRQTDTDNESEAI